MRRTADRRITAALGAMLVCGQAALGQDAQSSGSGASLEDQLRSMQQEMDKLRQDNSKMRGEIDDLRASTQDNWLTEQRAAEIRGLVQDVLADADTRASLLNDGMTAGWSENFFLASPDGRFLLAIDGQSQIRFIWNYTENPDKHRYGFENARTRLTLRGHVFTPDLTYLFRQEFSRASLNQNVPGGFSQLLDAWVRYDMDNDWSARVGQFKLPFNREELVSSEQQLLVERSLVNQFMNIGRSQGFDVAMVNNTDRWVTAFSDGASSDNPTISNIIGGPHTNTSALVEDVEYAFTSRWEHLFAGNWRQFEDFTSPRGEEYGLMMGFAAHYQRGESNGAPSIQRNETDFFAAAGDVSIEWGGASAFAGITYFYIDQANGGIIQVFGVVGQVAAYVAPKWELFFRGEFMQLEVTGAAGAVPDMGILTGGVNYYIEGHDVKWTTDIGVSVTQVSGFFASDLAGWRADTANEGEVVFRTQLQLLF